MELDEPARSISCKVPFPSSPSPKPRLPISVGNLVRALKQLDMFYGEVILGELDAD